MTQGRRIVELLGGTAKAAGILRRKPPTIISWVQRGFIPAREHLAVLQAANDAGIDLTPCDFFYERDKVAPWRCIPNDQQPPAANDNRPRLHDQRRDDQASRRAGTR
jgi:hypothetical protein